MCKLVGGIWTRMDFYLLLNHFWGRLFAPKSLQWGPYRRRCGVLPESSGKWQATLGQKWCWKNTGQQKSMHPWTRARAPCCGASLSNRCLSSVSPHHIHIHHPIILIHWFSCPLSLFLGNLCRREVSSPQGWRQCATVLWGTSGLSLLAVGILLGHVACAGRPAVQAAARAWHGCVWRRRMNWRMDNRRLLILKLRLTW